jgi:hypothetical protein
LVPACPGWESEIKKIEVLYFLYLMTKLIQPEFYCFLVSSSACVTAMAAAAPAFSSKVLF